ncbi:MAG TPA: MotA/TolQ/ExbB proton channel family protein [Planctomycetota bacterium]|nr:MotA/TolQ/ExbB proton channel family protein [Planctomycetota bacterium]
MRTLKTINWKAVSYAFCMALIFTAAGVLAEEGGKKGGGHVSLLDQMKDAGFVEYILLLVSIAGFALTLQACVTLRAHLLRPPELAAELSNLVQEGNVEGAFDVAQGDNSLLGALALATLSNAQYGKEAMESAMADAGEVEGNKIMNKISTLSMIAAIAPMLGLTGTTVGMIETFSTMAAGGAEITADKMAKGISIALICTFTGLMVAIPLIVVAFFLKAKVIQVILECQNDCNEMIRIISSGEQPAEG